jgi:hypothetical protein
MPLIRQRINMADLPKPPRSRFWQINVGTLFLLVLVVAIGLAWWRDRQRIERRFARIEQSVSTRGYYGWGVDQALGPPDESGGSGSRAWCPATTSGRDWLLLEYKWRIRPAKIIIHETYSTGGVTKVSIFDYYGKEYVVWQGKDPTPVGQPLGVLTLAVKEKIKTKYVRVHIDPNAPSWNCIDAVALVDSRGKKYWATGAKASSSYGT